MFNETIWRGRYYSMIKLLFFLKLLFTVKFSWKKIRNCDYKFVYVNVQFDLVLSINICLNIF